MSPSGAADWTSRNAFPVRAVALFAIRDEPAKAWAELRERSYGPCKRPNTGMAVITDGERKNPPNGRSRLEIACAGARCAGLWRGHRILGPLYKAEVDGSRALAVSRFARGWGQTADDRFHRCGEDHKFVPAKNRDDGERGQYQRLRQPAVPCVLAGPISRSSLGTRPDCRSPFRSDDFAVLSSRALRGPRRYDRCRALGVSPG